MGGILVHLLNHFHHDIRECYFSQFQGEPGTIKNHALAEMANMLMEEPVFNRLRTEEQLGYTVYSMLRNTFGVLGISISIYAQVRFLV